MVRIKVSFLFVIFVVLVFSSCKRNPYKADISNIQVEMEIQRFEQDLFVLDISDLDDGVKALKAKYGEFVDLFSARIINIGLPGNPAYNDYLTRFLTDFMINSLYDEVQKKFSDLEPLEDKLEHGFRHYKHHFPEKGIPDVVTYISGFNHSLAVDDSILGIGLDKYLGADSEYYKKLGYENYLVQDMVPERIPFDALKVWAMTEWEYSDSIDNLLSQMIYKGRLAYFVKSMFPEASDAMIMAYTEDEMKFCRNNEAQMWLFLIENKLLFTTDQLNISKYVNEAPFTKGFSNESPGQAAVWLGWRIVEAYMKENKKITLSQLMEESNYQKILTLSNYHP